MKPKQLITVALLIFVALSVIHAVVHRKPETSPSLSNAAEPQTTGLQQAESAPPEVMVYYFHRTARCMTCNTIEAYTGEVLQNSFGEALAAGKMRMASMDYEQPANRHFITDFALVANSVVLVHQQDGQIKRWKNLPEIWTLVQNQTAFQNYIRQEVEAFVRETL